MSYEIVYDRRFIRSPLGITPMILAGSNNCYEPMPNGRERRNNLLLLLEYAKTSEATGSHGLAGYLRMIERMEAELGSPCTVIATGGIAKFIVPLCKTPIVYDKDLLIKGLAALYRDNKRS